MGRTPDPERSRIRGRPEPGADPREPRHAQRARQEQPVSRPQRGREPGSFRPHACRRVSGWRAGAAREDRHGVGNINLRDPVLYRILHASHPRTGDEMVHLSNATTMRMASPDAIESITHSLCTLSSRSTDRSMTGCFDHLPVPSRPRQIEFARLNITHTVLSKRVLTELVRSGQVEGWDDPRMPTLAGLRRRGVPPVAIS